MALTITSPLTTYNVCDDITNWNNPGDGIDTDEKIEGTGCHASDVDVETETMIGPSITSINMVTTKYAIYPWVLNFTAAYLDLKANGGLFVILGDGTNESYWYVGGRDTYPGGWEVLVANTDASPDGNSGTAADLTAITDIGFGFKGVTKSKLADNSFLDYIRYGSGAALKITGTNTTTGDGWSEVLTGDTTLIAGIIKAQTGSYVIKGPVQIGDDSGTLSTTFSDEGTAIIFDSGPVGDNHHAITCKGNATGTTSVTFTNQTFIAAGGRFTFDQTDASLDTFAISGGSLTHANAVKFKSGQTAENVVFSDCSTFSIANAPSGCTFAVSGLLTLETGGELDGCLVDEPTGSIGVTAAIGDVVDITDTTFISDGTGHGIEITGTATNITLTDLVFSGYDTADPGTAANKAIYVNIGTGTMTINISGGSGVTEDYHVRSAGATVTVSADTTITFTGMKDNSEVRIYKVSDDSVVAGIEDATTGTTDNRSFQWSAPSGTEVYYRIHCFEPGDEIYQTVEVASYTVPANDTDVAIIQTLDRNVEN